MKRLETDGWPSQRRYARVLMRLYGLIPSILGMSDRTYKYIEPVDVSAGPTVARVETDVLEEHMFEVIEEACDALGVEEASQLTRRPALSSEYHTDIWPPQ